MKCMICGNPTGKFFSSCHNECAAKLCANLRIMDEVLCEYGQGQITHTEAQQRFESIAMDELCQKYFWKQISIRSDLKSYDKLYFAHNQICAAEEKNRCQMVRTGLSYAKYPQWESQSVKICDMGTIALTSSGVYILSLNNYHIPYNRIVDVGCEGDRLYIDVKTTSAQRHRYTVWHINSGKHKSSLASGLCNMIRFIGGVKNNSIQGSLMDNPPSPIREFIQLSR